MERADIAIVGTGPAGVSAAITAKVRGKTVLLFGSRELSSKLTKAHKIQNYPGLPDIDGVQLAQALKSTWMCWKSQSQRSRSRRCMPWAAILASRRRMPCWKHPA